MSKKQKRETTIVQVRIPLWRTEWEEFRECVRDEDGTSDPVGVLRSLIRAVVEGEITVTRAPKPPFS